MKLRIKTLGYINLISHNKVETNKKGTPKIYRSRKMLLLAKRVQEYRSKAKAEFNKALAKAGILESAVDMARGAIRSCKGLIMTTAERFTMMVKYWKALQTLNTFKRALPYSFKSILF